MDEKIFIFYIIINVSIYLIDCFISKYSKNEEIVSENIEPEYVRIPNEIVQENLDIKPNEFTNDFEP